jgi:carboxyl-terminal processing protease
MMRGFPLADGSVLVLVVGQVRTPCGRAVQRQYRGLSSRDYYRLASADRDTVGRPTCKTKAGRTVYGGGGIYPDVRTPRPAEPPVWYAKANELEIPLAWVGGFITEHGASLGTLESFLRAPALPPAAAASFRAFARERGVEVPTGEADAKTLDRMLWQVVSFAKWGNAGLYQVDARLDPAVAHAARSFAP